MAIPIIDDRTSILGYRQYEEWSYQPYARNAPTSWLSSPLPAGLTLNAPTGLISGAVELPGVYVLAVRASNTDGTSEALVLTIGIQAAAGDPTVPAIDLALDIITREVTSQGASEESLFYAKRGDHLIFRVAFQKGGTTVPLTLTALRIALLELDGDPILVQSSADGATGWSELSPGLYLLALTMASAALTSALSNHEQDTAASFSALLELTWTAENDLPVGPSTVSGTSRTFRAQIVRDLVA